jgi:N-acetylglucosamine-6-sulfatase
MRRGRQAAAALAFITALAGASLALGACSSSTATAPDPKTTATGGRDGRPNVVVIQADDQTVAQFTRRVMPNTFKLLVDHGTTFKDYIATTALCCPSRASLITGQYAHNHGVFANGGDKGGYQALRDKGNVLPVWLERAGYNTIHLGKFLNGYWKVGDDPAAVGPGWDDWQTLINKEDAYYDYDLSNNAQVVHYGDKPRDYVTRVLERKAVRAIRDYSKVSAPFYLQFDERAPHVERNKSGPCSGRTRYPLPAPKDQDRFRHAQLPAIPSYDEKRMGDKPAFLRHAPRISARAKRMITKHWRCSLASLVSVDRSVARVYNAVKKAGELDRTVFIYLSDNGQFFGEHRVATGKVLPYEEALRQPLVISVPKRYRDGASRVRTVNAAVGNIDLAPTILDLAQGRSCPAGGGCRAMDGRSLLPLLTDQGHWPQQRALLSEYRVFVPHHYGTCKFAAIRTPTTLYAEHYSVTDLKTDECARVRPPEVERYDLTRDPFELNNLCHGGSLAACPVGRSQQRLEGELKRLRKCAGVKGRDERIDGRPFCS